VVKTLFTQAQGIMNYYSAFFSSLFFMLFFPYRTKLITNFNKFVKRGKNWKKWTKVKKANTIGGSSKIHLKHSLWFSNFKKYNFSIPQYLKNPIVVQNFIFFYFLVFDLREEIKSGWILVVKRENLGWH